MQGEVMPSRALIWVAILIGSTIGGAIPELWGAEMLSFTSLLLSGIGGLVGLWIVFKM
jgi:predicted MFS family arabinose efflux permease